jgi:hypothetical protein
MIEDLEKYLIGIALGIRFRANFSIEDNLGKIVDEILYSDKAYFTSSFFPLVENSFGLRNLINPDTEDQIKLDNSNVVLEINFENSKFKKDDLDLILKKFNIQIIQGVLKQFQIKEIRRIGFVKRYRFDIPELVDNFICKTVGETLGGINDINLHFSKKIPLEEALVKKNVDDYDNVIFHIIKKTDENDMLMSVDYQSFFEPFLPNSAMIQFSRFTEKVDRYNSTKYLEWLNSNYLEKEYD